MPLPLVWAGVGVLTGMAVAKFGNPALLPIEQMSGVLNRSFAPSINDMLRAYIQGEVSDETLGKVAALNNISMRAAGGTVHQDFLGSAWLDVRESTLIRLDPSEVAAMYYQGVLIPETAKRLFKKFRIKEDNAEAIWKAQEGKLDLGIIFQNSLRGEWGNDTAIKKIRRLYQVEEDRAREIFKLRNQIPPPTDLVRFAVREVFNPEQVRELGLDREYEDNRRMIEWFKAQGITDNMALFGMGEEEAMNWIKAYWIAHWQLPSPTQSYEFLHRLRPNRVGRWRDVIPDLKPFMFSDLNRLLKANDYSPPYRGPLAAISYRVIGRIDLRRLYNDDVIDDAEVLEQIKDQGYNDTDAVYIRDWMVKQKRDKKSKDDEKENNRKFGRMRSQILNGFKDGSVSYSTALQALVSTGVKEADALIQLNGANIEVNVKLVRQYIKMVKDEFMLGQTMPDEALQLLVSGGVAEERARQYVILWQRQLGRPRKTVSANQVLEWYAKGYMGEEEAIQRLRNLGFSNADLLLYSQEAFARRQTEIAAVEAARARTQRQAEQAARRLAREAAAAIRSAQSHLRTYSGLTQMRRWYLDDLIDLATVSERMELLGIPDADRQRYLDEWIAEYNERHAE